jgi:hypothetical protein
MECSFAFSSVTNDCRVTVKALLVHKCHVNVDFVLCGQIDVVRVRVPHGYTAGTKFLNRTHTRVHRTRSGCGYIPYRNFRGFIRNPRYELYPRFLSLKYIVNYMIIL